MSSRDAESDEESGAGFGDDDFGGDIMASLGLDLERSAGPGGGGSDYAKYGGCCFCCILCCVGVVLATGIRTVPPGQVGLVSTFAYVKEQPMLAGTHFGNPFSVITPFSIQTTLLDFRQTVPTKEGLAITLEVAMLYHINVDNVRNLYLKVGTEYEQVYIKPELESEVRQVTSNHGYQALYNTKRDTLQRLIKEAMSEKLKSNGVVVENVLLNDVKLPANVVKSIEEKANAEQQSKRMEFVLKKAESEAKRKEIEAQGIQAFQTIVSKGISPELLQWKGIEATEKFSETDSDKIVVMGNSGSSLPVLFNAEAAAKAAV
jgi:regulator of protease activity HflC (stomatin/prohibitin superfamily)